MNNTNCINCGAPYKSICKYCGADYTNVTPPIGVSSLTQSDFDFHYISQQGILIINPLIR